MILKKTIKKVKNLIFLGKKGNVNCDIHKIQEIFGF
jgi:hypothetical protein